MKQSKIIIKKQLVFVVLLCLVIPMVSLLGMEARETPMNESETTTQVAQPRTWLAAPADWVRSFMASHSDPVSASHVDSSDLQYEQGKPAQATTQEPSITFIDKEQEQVADQSSVPVKTFIAPVPKRVGLTSILDLNVGSSVKNRPISQLSISRPGHAIKYKDTSQQLQNDIHKPQDNKVKVVQTHSVESTSRLAKQSQPSIYQTITIPVIKPQAQVAMTKIFMQEFQEKIGLLLQEKIYTIDDAIADAKNKIITVAARDDASRDDAYKNQMIIKSYQDVVSQLEILQQQKQAASVGLGTIVEPVLSSELLTNKEEQLVDNIIQDSQLEMHTIMNSSLSSQQAQIETMMSRVAQSILASTRIQDLEKVQNEVETVVRQATKEVVAQSKSGITLQGFRSIISAMMSKIKKLLSFLSGSGEAAGTSNVLVVNAHDPIDLPINPVEPIKPQVTSEDAVDPLIVQ